MAATREQVRTADVVERRGWTPGFGPGMLLGGIGALGVIVSTFLPWRDGVHPSNIPVEFLWNRDATGDPSLLVFLIPLAILLAVGAFVPMGAGLRLFGAIGTIIVAMVFAFQLNRLTDAFGGSLGDLLDTGFYFAMIGGILGFVSSLLPSGWGVRREVIRNDVVDDSRRVTT
jgi:hypothetical protein